MVGTTFYKGVFKDGKKSNVCTHKAGETGSF